MRTAMTALLGLLLFQVPALACRVDPVAAVPLTRAGGVLLVPVSVNGLTSDFVLDTGAERTVIGLAAAERLGVARNPWVSTDTQGAGGRDQRRLGRPSTLSLGGVALRRHTVAADHSVVVGPIMDSIDSHPVSGLLGQDFLSGFDLDIDAPGGTVTLYGVAGCSGTFIPWHHPVIALPAARPVRNILVLPVRVDGQALTAELDTGAAVSVVMAPGMTRLGLPGGGGDRIRGFGSGSVAARLQDFTVQVGGLPAAQTHLLVSPIRGLRSIDMLLGADWAASRRVWVSWATNQVFVPG